jgi:hypothetical protein
VSIGIPFPSIDPLRFLVDEQIRPSTATSATI